MLKVLACIRYDHDYRLIIVAVAICALTSWTAWYLYAMSLKAHGLTKAGWLVQTGVAAGAGIWATHFIAMLAFKSNLPTNYDAKATLLSLLVAILITGAGFAAAALERKGWCIIAGGLAIGIGIGSMHYSGMMAISVPGYINWEPTLVVVSIVLGIVFSLAAVWCFFKTNSAVLAATLLTLAICSLHFTAMAAATINFDPTIDMASGHDDNTLLAAIAAVTLLVLMSGITAALINLETAKTTHERIKNLRHQAEHDHLTGLVNRGTITQAIETAILSAAVGDRSNFALLFIDLDRFKLVNDTLGHAAGDSVLREAATRLRGVACAHSLVGRLGGDEFIVLQPSRCEPSSSAELLASAIAQAFEKPFKLPDGNAASLGVSIGIASFPTDGQDMESILRAADIALYRAKQGGGPRVRQRQPAHSWHD